MLFLSVFTPLPPFLVNCRDFFLRHRTLNPILLQHDRRGAVNRNMYGRQHHRQHNDAEQHHAVEAVERLTTEQDGKAAIEQRQQQG